MKKAIFYIALLAVLLASCENAPVVSLSEEKRGSHKVTSGKEGVEDPVFENGFILISSFAELKRIGTDPRYPLAPYKDGAGEFYGYEEFYGYKLVKDIDASESRGENGECAFEPIGVSRPDGFSAIFDGQGFAIKNLYVKYNLKETDFGFGDTTYIGTGLFASVGGYLESEIKNVILKDVVVEGPLNVGGLVGCLRGGTISNCGVSGIVRWDGVRRYLGTREVGGSGIGGIVGMVDGDEFCGGIQSCYSNVIVEGRLKVGGIVGHYGGGVLRESYAIGQVLADSLVGGLVGFGSEVRIERSFTVVKVIGKTDDKGGLYGKMWSTDCESAVVDSYWNVELVAVSAEKHDSSGIYRLGNCRYVTDRGLGGLTSEEMKNKDKYKNWDFTKIWRLSPGDSYPTLLNTKQL